MGHYTKNIPRASVRKFQIFVKRNLKPSGLWSKYFCIGRGNRTVYKFSFSLFYGKEDTELSPRYEYILASYNFGINCT